MSDLEIRTGVSRTSIYRNVGNKAVILEKLAQHRGTPYTKVDLRHHILLASRRVFGKFGILAATIEHIAMEADVGVATVYRLFGDKENLIKEFISEITPREVLRERALHPSDDIVADLEYILEAALVFFIEYRDIIRIILLGSETERHYFEKFQNRSDSTLDRMASYFQYQLDNDRLNTDCSAHELALALMGLIISFAVIGPHHYGTQLTHPKDMSKKITELFLGDLRKNL